MSSMVNLSMRMRRRPSICQTTREHANASIATSDIRDMPFPLSLFSRPTKTVKAGTANKPTNMHAHIVSSTRQLGSELQDLRLEPNVK
jgi:hypothetical protein